ncbi:hypothetical protein ACF0H5_014226 [Mactra antiquata]
MATSELYEKTYTDGSDLQYDLLCVPCHFDNIIRPVHGYCKDCGEHLCALCYNSHLKPAPCRYHRLLDHTLMPTSQQLPDAVAAVNAGPPDHLSSPCEQHNGKILELYCKDHGQLLCSICVSLNHSRSCHVDYIPDISKQSINSKLYQDTIERIDKLVEQCETINTEVSVDSKISNESLTKALSDVKKYKHDINMQIKKIVKQIEEKIRVLKQQNTLQVESVEKLCGDIIKESKAMQNNMQHFNSYKLANQLFVEMTKAQKLLTEYNDSISVIISNRSCSFDEYKFVPEQDIKNVLKTLNKIGDIERVYQVRVKPTSQDKIYVSTIDDVYTCLITGMAMISPDKLVLCDSDNKSIKLVDLNSKIILSQLSVGPTLVPWDLTSVSSQPDAKVAITFRNRQRINFLSVTNKLTEINTIKTNGVCRGICCHGDKLIVTYFLPSKLEILDMKGNVIKTVDKDTVGKDIFSSPNYVQANSEHIYVSNLSKQEIIMFKWNGDVIARFRDLEGPAGLILLGDKRLLVCDQRANILYQLSADCQHKKVVMQNLKCPKAICVDDKLEKIYISVGHRDFLRCDDILILNI